MWKVLLHIKWTSSSSLARRQILLVSQLNYTNQIDHLKEDEETPMSRRKAGAFEYRYNQETVGNWTRTDKSERRLMIQYVRTEYT